jgi:hypothetical protein
MADLGTFRQDTSEKMSSALNLAAVINGYSG